MTLRLRSLMTLFFLVAFCIVIYDTWDLELQAKLMPFGVGFTAIGLLIWQLYSEVLPANSQKAEDIGMDLAFSEEENSSEGKWRTLEMFGWIFGAAILLWLIGFFISIPMIIFLYLVRQRESLAVTILLPLLTGLAVWGMFTYFASIPFPPGEVWEWLGMAV